jgi:glycosyltransferase involved in cell wall biosynthesis
MSEHLCLGVDALASIPGKSGAVGAYRNLLQCAPKVDPSLELVFFVSSIQKEYYEKFLDAKVRERIRFVVFDVNSSNIFQRIFIQNLKVPEECKRQGVNVHYSSNPAPLFAIRGTHEVFKVTDLQFMEVPHEFGFRKRIYREFMGRKKASRSDLILANSKYTQQGIVKFFGIPKDRIKIVSEALDHSLFHPQYDQDANPQDVLDKYGIKPPFIIYVSSFRPYKNHLSLIKAYKSLIDEKEVDQHLVLVGNDINEYRSTVEKVVSELHIENRVHFLDYVHHWDLPAFYQKASLAVYPSLYETFGIPPLEAMACGTPVIVSNRTCLPEVSGGGALIVDCTDIPQLSEAMIYVLSNDKYKRELIDLGLKWSQQYTWQRSVQETIDLCKSIL